MPIAEEFKPEVGDMDEGDFEKSPLLKVFTGEALKKLEKTIQVKTPHSFNKDFDLNNKITVKDSIDKILMKAKKPKKETKV